MADASATIRSAPATMVGTPRSGTAPAGSFSFPPTSNAPTTSWPRSRAVSIPQRVTGG